MTEPRNQSKPVVILTAAVIALLGTNAATIAAGVAKAGKPMPNVAEYSTTVTETYLAGRTMGQVFNQGLTQLNTENESSGTIDDIRYLCVHPNQGDAGDDASIKLVADLQGQWAAN